MKPILTLLFTILLISSCNSQNESNRNTIIGGPCEDCEATLDYKKLDIQPTPTLTIKGFDNINPKIKITGTVLKVDGRTPAADIVLYVYHTNRAGKYEPSNNPIGWERRHGQYRGWLKTDADGKFEFSTFRPGAYPNGRESAHIHLYVEEPGKNPYYLDNYLFDDDPMLTDEEKNSVDNRGGSGIIKLAYKDGVMTAHRDIILGLNIPGY